MRRKAAFGAPGRFHQWREPPLGAANRLHAGCYGLTTILLFVACMTVARVRNPEPLRYQAAGE